MYLPTFFKLEEWVDPETFDTYGPRAWEFLDERILMTYDQLRTKYGAILINNWHLSGEREWSGLRTEKSPYYSPSSQHSFGRAGDGLFLDTDIEVVRKDILKKPEEFPLITGIEMEVEWLHIDCRNTLPIKQFTAG